MAIAVERAPILSSEDLSEEETPVRRFPRARVGVAGAAAALLAATGLLFLAARSSAPSLFRVAANPRLTGLHENHTEEEIEDEENPCDSFPFLRINNIKSNNLGGHGPDKDAEEGIIYRGVAHHLGMNTTDVEVHLHAVSHTYFGHSEEEGANVSHNYKPQWPKVNGVRGHFGTINVQPGTNVTVVIHGFDPENKTDIILPRFAITFFDLDTGKDGERSVEFLKVQGYEAYYVTNETEINITEDDDGSTRFTATVEGTGDDNPTNPLILTEQQKNRAVSFEFHNTGEVTFEVGSSEGHTARVFQFVIRPIMRCAQTKLADGTLVGATDPNSPISLVRGAAHGGRPSAGFATVLTFALASLSLSFLL